MELPTEPVRPSPQVVGYVPFYLIGLTLCGSVLYIICLFSCGCDFKEMILQIGSTFLQQYYAILHESPESFYRFYQDSSILSRPDSNGEMKSVTTTQVKFCTIHY